MAKDVFKQIFHEDIDPEKYVEEHGLKMVNDEGALRETAAKVIADNPQAVADFKGGKEKAIRSTAWTDNARHEGGKQTLEW